MRFSVYRMERTKKIGAREKEIQIKEMETEQKKTRGKTTFAVCNMIFYCVARSEAKKSTHT